MIIGHGDIASVLPDRQGFIFFASGVSNSQETREEEYARERSLLLVQDRSKHLVYFSTLAVFYADNRYVQHKMEMEQAVKDMFNSYTILRLGNITWGTNPHTLINFIRSRIRQNLPCEIKDEYRYIVDKDEFLHWMGLIPDWSCEMNITGRRMKVVDIVYKYGYT